MPTVPIRAAFRRGPRRFDVGELATDLVLDSTVGFPLPRPGRSNDDLGTGLPPRFVLEVGTDEVHVLDEAGQTVVERWARGAVDARIDLLTDENLWLELRWPGSQRSGRIASDASPEARELAEVLVDDTTVRRGASRESVAALRRLVAESLPEELQSDRHAAISAMATMLGDERPLVVAAATRGLSDGVVVLTERALRWWAGGRKDPLVVPRDQVRAAATSEPIPEAVDLTVQPRAGKDIVLTFVEPAERAVELARALNPRADPLDELLARERDGSAFLLLRDRLERARQLLEDDERVATYAGATRGARSGVVVVTDRRLLWVPRKGSPIEIPRAQIERADGKRGRILSHVRVRLTGGREERFDVIEPPDRTADVLEALRWRRDRARRRSRPS